MPGTAILAHRRVRYKEWDPGTRAGIGIGIRRGTEKASLRKPFRDNQTGCAGWRLSRGGHGRGIDAHLLAVLPETLELHRALDEGVDGVVAADAHVVARMP